jgi:fructokinase
MHTDTYTPAVCYGEVLWDVLPDGPKPGGAPLNVSYHLSKLGVGTSIVSRIGNDANGRRLEELIGNWGISKRFLQHDAHHPTSEVIANLGNGNEVSYEIVFPVAWDFIDSSEDLSGKLDLNNYLIFGSLSSRNAVSRDTLLELLESESIKVFDINLRPPFVNRDLIKTLLYKADIVKFNQAELDMAQHLFRGSYGNEKEQVRFIQEEFGVSEIIVTKGEFGASYYTNNSSYHASGTEVKVKDTIGSGDAFLAAFIANHYAKNEPRTIIKNAVAMGAFIATKEGGCPPYALSDYLEFKNQIFN